MLALSDAHAHAHVSFVHTLYENEPADKGPGGSYICVLCEMEFDNNYMRVCSHNSLS